MNAITLTSLKIDGHTVEIPKGLSELLADTWSNKKVETQYSVGYDREVLKKGERFVTVLRKKKEVYKGA